MYDTRIINGTLVTHTEIYPADLCIQDGRIAAITMPGQTPEAAETIDAQEKLLFPGAIDCHSHFQVPGYTHRETFETGSRAAAAGGVTTVIDMPLNNDPPIINADAFHLKKRLIEGQSYVDYALWGGAVDDNLDELETLCRSGVVALKGFLSPVREGEFVNITLWQLKRVMEIVKAFNIPLGLHCEDYTLLRHGRAEALQHGKTGIRDFLEVHSPLAEQIAVANAIAVCRETGARLHICHVSHPDAAQLIDQAQREGLPVTAETCPHYLGFTSQRLYEVGARAKCTPPLRGREDVDRLWDYVVNGCLSCIGSDHSPATPAEKDDTRNTIWESWGGMNSIQLLLPYFYHLAVNERGRSPTLVADKLAYQPSRLFGLKGKGQLLVGYDADIVVFDPNSQWTVTDDWLQTMHKVSAFTGVSGTGLPAMTLMRGRVTANDGLHRAKAKGWGRFLTAI